MITSGPDVFTANPAYLLQCEGIHALFSLAWSVPLLVALALISSTYGQHWGVRRIYLSAFALCFSVGSISHYLADTWNLGF